MRPFKIGDRVVSDELGEGVVERIDADDEKLPVLVRFKKGDCYWFSSEGKYIGGRVSYAIRHLEEKQGVLAESDLEIKEIFPSYFSPPQSQTLTKREQVALAAMQGLVTEISTHNEPWREKLAQRCFEIADAFLKESNNV